MTLPPSVSVPLPDMAEAVDPFSRTTLVGGVMVPNVYNEVDKELPELTIREEIVLAMSASRVTAYPPSIKTASPLTGTEAPDAPPDVADQVLVEFQLPEATE